MKVTQTLIATGPNGEELAFVKPTVMVWAKDTDEVGVMLSVAQLLDHARDLKFTKTLSITIEL